MLQSQAESLQLRAARWRQDGSSNTAAAAVVAAGGQGRMGEKERERGRRGGSKERGVEEAEGSTAARTGQPPVRTPKGSAFPSGGGGGGSFFLFPLALARTPSKPSCSGLDKKRRRTRLKTEGSGVMSISDRRLNYPGSRDRLFFSPKEESFWSFDNLLTRSHPMPSYLHHWTD